VSPRAREESVRPRLQSGDCMRPLNFTVRFHMKRSAIVVAILSISLVNSAQAKCIHHPEMRASVTIQGCVAATFGATNAKSALFGDPEPMYRSGEALSGTLLTVSVKTARFTWSDAMGHSVNGAHLWRKGETHTLFVRDAPTSVCPDVLPADVEVQTQRVCCDTIPGTWECLLPRSISLVNVISLKLAK
jgi:hypothetical protein